MISSEKLTTAAQQFDDAEETFCKMEKIEGPLPYGLIASRPLLIAPVNIDADPDDYYYSSTSLSFRKFAHEETGLEFLTKPSKLLDQRSADVFLPTIIFTLSHLSQNPEIAAVLLETATNFIKISLGSISKKDPVAEVKIIISNPEQESYKKLEYKGPVSGLKSLEALLDKATKHES